MNLIQQARKVLMPLLLVLVLVTTAACGGPSSTNQANYPTVQQGRNADQIERGNTGNGQEFGSWAVQTGRGLIQDAYVRDNNKLGVVISPQVRPNEVRPLAKSLMQGFQKNFPDRDLTVLMYAPDKKLVLTASYDQETRQISYQ